MVNIFENIPYESFYEEQKMPRIFHKPRIPPYIETIVVCWGMCQRIFATLNGTSVNILDLFPHFPKSLKQLLCD